MPPSCRKKSYISKQVDAPPLLRSNYPLKTDRSDKRHERQRQTPGRQLLAQRTHTRPRGGNWNLLQCIACTPAASALPAGPCPSPLAHRPGSAPTAAKVSGHMSPTLRAPAGLASSCGEERRRNPTRCPGTVCGWWREEAGLPEPLQPPREQRCLGPFPADFISYWVKCGIASSSATSSNHRGRRISRPFLLIAEGTSSFTEAGPVQEMAAPARWGELPSAPAPQGTRSGGRGASAAPGSTPRCPPAQQAGQLHQDFQPSPFPAERGVARLSSVQASSAGARRTRPHGPR